MTDEQQPDPRYEHNPRQADADNLGPPKETPDDADVSAADAQE